MKSFLVFRCGHKFHKKCVVSKKQIDNEEKKNQDRGKESLELVK